MPAGMGTTKQTMKGNKGFKMPKSSRPSRRYVVHFLWLLLVSATACFGAAPMGWNSWNSFANIVNSQIVQQQAKALASNGMKEAGYEYVVIDEGWWLGERDAAGNIVVDPKQWPAIQPGQKDGDMANIAAYIHSLGLKAGIYTDAGRDGCSMYPDSGPKYLNTGSEGHYDQDFLQFSKWGFDYVKVDWCGGAKERRSGAVQYAQIARAIQTRRKDNRAEVVLLHLRVGQPESLVLGSGRRRHRKHHMAHRGRHHSSHCGEPA